VVRSSEKRINHELHEFRLGVIYCIHLREIEKDRKATTVIFPGKAILSLFL
jgi:hypothetical protein